MKKIYALIAFATLLVSAGVLSRVYAYPTLAVIPLDTDVTVVAKSVEDTPATYFSIADLSEVTGSLTSVTRVRANTELTDDAREELDRDVVVFDTYSCSDPSDADDDLGKDCRANSTPLSGELGRYALDQQTGELVEWSGARTESGGQSFEDVPFAGYTVKLPFNVQKQSYEMWDGGLQRTVTAEYVGETEFAGVKAYEFHTAVPATVLGELELPGSLAGSSEASVTADRVYTSSGVLIVEPESGLLIGGSSSVDSYAEIDGERVLTISKGEFAVAEEEAAAGAEDAADTGAQLRIVRVTGPLVAVTLGMLLLVLAIVLLVRRRRAGHDVAAAPRKKALQPA